MTAWAFITDGFPDALKGFLIIQTHPARLISDYIEIAGLGGAFLNAALVGFIGLILVRVAGIPHSGPTYAAILTMTGFGLFGKTPVNILPIILGVYLAARLVGKRFQDYLIIALFGTALGPLVNTLAWELGLSLGPALLAGSAGGVLTGFFLPSVAVTMLHIHQGYNLYNMGMTCGFFGLFAASLLRGFGFTFSGRMDWHVSTPGAVLVFILAFSLALLAIGLVLGKKKSLIRLKEVLSLPGRLPSDFVDMASLSGALTNSALIGLFSTVYLLMVKAPLNGPVLGGILTIMGFGAFGSHIKNSWPVVTGVAVTTLLTGNELNAPGPVLAAIFCTTLAPLAGEFGILAGLAAGSIHLLMVMQTGGWHGGMNLYNNGFAGGLTAGLIIAVIQWYRTNKEEF